MKTSFVFLLVLFFCRRDCSIRGEKDDEEDDFGDLRADYCRDDNDMCSQWAENGECEANPNYMERSCARSCGVCGSTSSNSVSVEEKVHRGGDLGVPQELEFHDGTREEDILYLIAKARNYMKYIVEEDYGEELVETCKNRNEQCAWWALSGECESNAAYMQQECAPICSSCHALTLEHRCPLDPNATNAWEVGDLNAMFERLTTEPYKSEYSVMILSSPELNDCPWVITMEDLISNDEANRLIELGHARGFKRSTDVGELRADGSLTKRVSEGRTSTNAWCTDECEEDPMASEVYKRLETLTGINRTNSENLQLLKYEESQMYTLHHDYILQHRNRQGGVRMLTVFLYLNEVEAGGGTNFDELNITVVPKTGRAVLWPSVLNDDPHAKDERTTHQALPVEGGIKYGANAWFHQRDFQSANRRGCMG